MYTFLIAPFSGFKQGGKGFYRDPLLGKKTLLSVIPSKLKP